MRSPSQTLNRHRPTNVSLIAFWWVNNFFVALGLSENASEKIAHWKGAAGLAQLGETPRFRVHRIGGFVKYQISGFGHNQSCEARIYLHNTECTTRRKSRSQWQVWLTVVKPGLAAAVSTQSRILQLAHCGSWSILLTNNERNNSIQHAIPNISITEQSGNQLWQAAIKLRRSVSTVVDSIIPFLWSHQFATERRKLASRARWIRARCAYHLLSIVVNVLDPITVGLQLAHELVELSLQHRHVIEIVAGVGGRHNRFLDKHT